MIILYAEDESAISELVTELLTMEGHEVTLVVDGEAAYSLLNDKTKHFDLLLTDHMMPKLKGVELVARVILEGSKIPVIVTSGSLHVEKQFKQSVSIMESGALLSYSVHFIPKPFDLDHLLDKIKEIENERSH